MNQPIIGPYQNIQQLDTFLYELTLAGILEDNEPEAVNFNVSFETTYDRTLVKNFYDSYVGRISQHLDKGNKVEKIELVRRVVNDFLDHGYCVEGSKEEKNLSDIVEGHGVRYRAFDICLASLFLNYAVQDNLLKREEREGKIYFSLMQPDIN